eukprot:g5093.t1
MTKSQRRRRNGHDRSVLWSDAYAPTRVEDVAVHKKKVQEVRRWMESAKSAQIRNARGGGSVLVLHGPTGCAKSTLVRILATELSVRLREIDRGAVGFEDTRFDTTMVRSFANSIRRRRYLDSAASELDSVAKLLRRGVRYRALTLDSSSSSLNEIGGSCESSVRGERRVEIVLIDPLPFLKDLDEQRRLSQLIEAFVSDRYDTTQSFAILVATEHTKPPADERRRANRSTWSGGVSVQYVLSSSVIDSPRVTCLRMNSIAKTAMRRALRRVVDLEGTGLSRDLADNVADTADGDLRHALQTLQWSATASSTTATTTTTSSFFKVPKTTKTKKTNAATSKRNAAQQRRKNAKSTLLTCGKRQFLVPFHAVGKILYAKRCGGDMNESSSRPPLAFDPESVVERSGLDASRCLDFVHHNCPEFFTQVEDLAATVSHFCDADLLLATGAKYPTRCDGAFPMKYVASVASRALAKENLSPAPRTFRKIVGPRGGGVWIATRENRRVGRQMLTSYAKTASEETILPGSTSLVAGFVDMLPALKTLSICSNDKSSMSRTCRSIGAFSSPLRTIEIGSRRPSDGVVIGSWDTSPAMPAKSADARRPFGVLQALGATSHAIGTDNGTIDSDPIED